METKFDWKLFLDTFPKLINALPITLTVGMAAMAIGLLIGTVIGVLRYSKIPVIDTFLKWYISFFRGTPLMIQLFIFFFGLPQIMPSLGKLNAFQASILIMSINAGAYISETIRASINSIDKLQFDAGYSVGFNYIETMRHIILPQAFRVAVPPLGNTFVGVIQGTSLTFMLGLKDVMGLSKMMAATNYRFFETYLAVGILYWIITLFIGRFNNYLEVRLSKGSA